MIVIFDKLANQELIDAVEYYEIELPGLGKKLKDEIRKGVQRIIEFPEAWSKRKKDIRHYLLHKFPYKILYSIELDYIYIIAIAHSHRKPDYWIDRITDKS